MKNDETMKCLDLTLLTPEENLACDEALLDCIARAIARGDTVSAARKGPTNAHAIARTLPGFPAALAAARKFWTSLERLEEAGKLVREQYVTAGNRRGERWCVPA